MYELYERPEMKEYGGGSGIWSADYDTPLGKVRVLHWSLTRGDVTEISVSGSFEGWPKIRLDGHIKTACPDRFYLEALLRLGGMPSLIEGVERAMRDSFEKGKEAARNEIRTALGLENSGGTR